ncbi:hypothetical protein [Krasilnikoviella flava]|uniref:Uncharacterized protein n=1 Tax=Krasilnikoviella flava TaxID=526729 RepID=A0A1T5IPB7_9MICO|nr:hypothetical protein [Krasilnikoviella flava]SKC40970.1 hypothetical protein SAMN04324258_0769 [Krasilnikoviella flava]
MLFDEEKDGGARAERRPSSVAARVAWGALWTVLALVALVVVVVAWWAHDVTTPDGGDGYADELAERTAIGIADDVEGHYAEPLDAETLAQSAVTDPRLAGGDDAEYEFQVLGWQGSSGDADGARIDLAISVDVAAWSSGAIFGDSRTAGRTTSCWHLVVRAYEYDDAADLEWFRCPDDVVGATPHPTAPPSLGPDAEATVLDVMDRLPVAVDPASAESALRYEFPSSVDVSVVWDGRELVAAVGVAEARDCIVAVRRDRSTSRYTDFDRILLEPGELGCVPSLYTSPVTTH